jgi:protein-tyrosine phosphatase
VPDADVIPFAEAAVTVGPDAAWEVSWAAPGVADVAVDAGPSTTGPWRSVGAAAGTGRLTVADDGEAPRRFVRLRPDVGAELVLGPRTLGLPSSPNLRDSGGYRTTRGQWVRMGALYRSGVLTLTADELATVTALGLRHDYDLRTPGENEVNPDVLPEGATRYSLNVSGGEKVEVPPLNTEADVVELMTRAPLAYMVMPSAVAAIGGLVKGLAENDGVSLFHCTAGKDRTGWAGAVLLGLLDVPDATVMADYLLSNTYYLDSPGMRAHLEGLPPDEAAAHRAMIGVRPPYLQTGLDAVQEQYGSMRGYAVEGLGVSPAAIDRLREKYLVGAVAG